jgi:hypothetical protein
MKKQTKKPTKARKRFSRLTLTTAMVATVILAIAAVTVASRQKATTNQPAEAVRSAQMAKKSNFVTVKVAGQDVQVDGQTGQIQPLTPEEAQKLAVGLGQMVNQSTEGLEQVQHEDGSVSMDLKGRFQNVSVARVNKDGSVTEACVDNPQAAGAFFGIDPKLIEAQQQSRTPIEGQPTRGIEERKQ